MITVGSFGEAQKREVVYSKDTATEEPVVSKQGLYEGVKRPGFCLSTVSAGATVRHLQLLPVRLANR